VTVNAGTRHHGRGFVEWRTGRPGQRRRCGSPT